MPDQSEREANLRVLADRLEFTVEKIGEHFKLTRTSDVSRPVCEDGLTLTEAEELLEAWKLRGFHGGMESRNTRHSKICHGDAEARRKAKDLAANSRD